MARRKKVHRLEMENFHEHRKDVYDLLDRMQNYLLTPSVDRKSFESIYLIHKIAEVRKELQKEFKYMTIRKEFESDGQNEVIV